MLLPLAREEGHDDVGIGRQWFLPAPITDSDEAEFWGSSC